VFDRPAHPSPFGVSAARMLTVITDILMQIRAGVCSQPPGSPQLRRDRPPVYTDTWPWCCPFGCPAAHIQITQPPCPSLIVTNPLRCTPCSPASSSARCCFEISPMCCRAFASMIPCSMDTTRLPRSPGTHFISCLIYSLCFIFFSSSLIYLLVLLFGSLSLLF
jgi:hypothetical protein